MDRSAAFHLAIISEARIDQGRCSRHRTKEFNLLELKNARARFRSGATDRGNPKRRLASLRNNIDRWRPPLFSISETRKKFDLICCDDLRGFTVSME